jgi:hypothetical protein
MVWSNSDSLQVRFGTETAQPAQGGEVVNFGGQHVFTAVIKYTDMLSATAAIVDGVTAGALGIKIPKGLYVEEVEVLAEAAFTSSGTIGTSTMVLGLIREDRSTVYTANGFTTTSFAGGSFDAAGEKTVLRVGSTGAGAFIGTALANDGYLVAANSQHGSHPFTAGKAKVTIKGYYPTA